MIGAQVGMKKESTWDTAVVVSLFPPFLEESLEGDFRRVEGQGQRAGQYTIGNNQTEPYLFGTMGPHSEEVHTKNFSFWLEMILGAVATSGPGGDGQYTYTGTFGPTLPSMTYQSNREFHPSGTDQPFTFSGVKVAKAKLSCGKDGIVTLAVDLVGGTLVTATALASSSTTSGLELLTHVKGELTIDGTQLPVEEWTIEVDNNLDTERGKQKANPLRQEPVRNGRPSVTWACKTDFDSMTQYNRVSSATATAIHKALVVSCKGPTVIGGTTYPELRATIAAARFDKGKLSAVKGAEALKADYSGVAASDFTNSPLKLEYITAQSTIPGT